MDDLALEADIFHALRLRYLNVGSREHRDHVARLQRQILRFIMIQNRLSQAEWNKGSLKRVRICPLNDSIAPVNTGSDAKNSHS